MKEAKKTIFVSDLQVKDGLEEFFLVKHLVPQDGRDGRPYLNIILCDRSGEIETRYFGARCMEYADQIRKGDYVRAKGRIVQYQNRKQFILNDIEPVSKNMIQEADFVIVSEKSSEAMYTQLETIVAGLEDIYIRELLQKILKDEDVRPKLLLWPAGKSIHHAYQSGLLEHILSCCETALVLSKHYQVNTSYVVAGCILHDLCKIYELSNNTLIEYTDEGKLVGHLNMGVELIDKFARTIEGIPSAMLVHLKHILIAHHGQYDYGSPKLPQTSEAMLVHLIDYMDSKMNSFEMVKKNDLTPGLWSSYVKHLDRIIYKGELPTFK